MYTWLPKDRLSLLANSYTTSLRLIELQFFINPIQRSIIDTRDCFYRLWDPFAFLTLIRFYRFFIVYFVNVFFCGKLIAVYVHTLNIYASYRIIYQLLNSPESKENDQLSYLYDILLMQLSIILYDKYGEKVGPSNCQNMSIVKHG